VANETLNALEAVEDPDETTEAAATKAAADVHNLLVDIGALAEEGQEMVLDSYGDDLDDVVDEDEGGAGA